MKGKDTTELRAALLAQGQTFASVADAEGVSRQHVRQVAAGLRTSERISEALNKATKGRSKRTAA